jgi:hypothetical protein
MHLFCFFAKEISLPIAPFWGKLLTPNEIRGAKKMPMLPSQVLMERIFEAALGGCDVDVAARRDALWDPGCCIMADVLRLSNPFTRERRLRTAVGS